MSNYLLELACVHIVLVSGYWILLRKERQYATMRWYLIFSAGLALTIPLLRLPKILFNGKELTEAAPIAVMPAGGITEAPMPETSLVNYDVLLVWVYIVVSVFFLVKFLGGALYLISLARKSRPEKFNDLYIRRVRNIKGSFTFFNWIFLSDQIDQDHDYDAILKHEKAHASQGHTYDLMFFELFKVCFWWLPTAWLVNKEIREIHEYQADACALESYDVDQYSSILMSSILKSNGVSLASSFHDSLILKRLIAMKKQTKNVSPWKLGALSALCALLVLVFACSEEPNKNTEAIAERDKLVQKVFMVVEAQPEFEGGIGGFRKYVMNEITYPRDARQNGVEGQVDVHVVVGKDGALTDVKVIKGIHPECDREAVRVFKNSPAFKPATQNGKPVFVRWVVPIVFQLDKEKKNPDNSPQGIIIVGDIQPQEEKLKVDATYADGEWTGKVYDENGEGLPGANIVILGTSTGTTTGGDGAFRLKGDQNKPINVSFVGYESVKLDGR